MVRYSVRVCGFSALAPVALDSVGMVVDAGTVMPFTATDTALGLVRNRDTRTDWLGLAGANVIRMRVDRLGKRTATPMPVVTHIRRVAASRGSSGNVRHIIAQ